MKTNPLNKSDDKRIKKFEEAVVELSLYQNKCFPITKLTSLKSLCKDYQVAIKFSIYIATCVSDKINSGYKPQYTDQKEWEIYKNIFSESFSMLQKYPNHKDNDLLYNQFKKLKDIQNETRNGHYGSSIRTIMSNEVLILEDAFKCILFEETSSFASYELGKDYAQTYIPSAGTGLTKDSILMLENIISFWREGVYLTEL